MAGIQVVSGNRTILVPAVWHDPEETPVVFIVVRDGSVGLAHPEYVSGRLYDINSGGLDPQDAWDELLVKTPEMAYPKPCQITADTLDKALVMVDDRVVFRMDLS